jgi:glucose-1-phosphate cytidylyltransferase
MQVVILADKYSCDTIEKIKENYKKQGMNEFIICRTSSKEMIEEYETNGCKIIEVKLEHKNKTGGQILKIANLLNYDEPFFLTYGDYLCSIDLKNFFEFHKKQGKVLSMAVIREDNRQLFGGYMLVDFDAIGYIENENDIFEKAPLTKIAEDDEIGWYYFNGKYQITYQHMKIYGF